MVPHGRFLTCLLPLPRPGSHRAGPERLAGWVTASGSQANLSFGARILPFLYLFQVSSVRGTTVPYPQSEKLPVEERGQCSLQSQAWFTWVIPLSSVFILSPASSRLLLVVHVALGPTTSFENSQKEVQVQRLLVWAYCLWGGGKATLCIIRHLQS